MRREIGERPMAGPPSVSRWADVDSRLRSARPTRLARFVVQRFPLLAYGPLIVALVVCGRTAAALASGMRPGLDLQAIATTLVVAVAFLQLRTLDEIRDAAIDRVGHPERPLPSGLVTESELRAFAVAMALVGIALTVPFGLAELAACSLSLLTIWTLGRYLPRRQVLKHGMLGEALLHSVIVPELLLVAWTSVAGLDAWAPLGAALLLAWGSGLAIELARKTVRPSEERSGVETYSGELGRPRAMLLGALAISAAWLGAGGLAVASHAAIATAVFPLIAAGSIPLLTQRFGERIETRAIRSTAPILVLCLLLWPLVIWAGSP